MVCENFGKKLRQLQKGDGSGTASGGSVQSLLPSQTLCVRFQTTVSYSTVLRLVPSTIFGKRLMCLHLKNTVSGGSTISPVSEALIDMPS